jgi:hypothetical protein
MKKLYFLILLVLSFDVVSAQEKLSKEEQARRDKNVQAGNPFAKYGSKAPVATLSKGKYLEVHDQDSIVTIGRMRWHVENQQIVGRIVRDSLNPDAQPIGDIVGRWISPDPLSEEFSNWSPYNMCFDNPLKFVDPDGRAAYSPIYGTNGEFLGTDSQGFKGQILFMDQKTFALAGGQGMDHKLAKSVGQNLDQIIGDNPNITFTESEVAMVNNAITDVASRTEGFGFSTFGNDLSNGKTSASLYEQGTPNSTPSTPQVWKEANNAANLGGAWPSMAQTNKDNNGKVNITFNLQEYSGDNFTVNNIQNTWVHEFGGHYKSGIPGGENASHAKAISNQASHSSWKGTTESYKSNMRNVYFKYTGTTLKK